MTFFGQIKGGALWRLPKPDFEGLKVLYVAPYSKGSFVTFFGQIKGGALWRLPKPDFEGLKVVYVY